MTTPTAMTIAMNVGRHLSVTKSFLRGESGWLLRWFDGAPRSRTRLSYWFVAEEEARAVQQAMKAGASFEQALHRLQDQCR